MDYNLSAAASVHYLHRLDSSAFVFSTVGNELEDAETKRFVWDYMAYCLLSVPVDSIGQFRRQLEAGPMMLKRDLGRYGVVNVMLIGRALNWMFYCV